MEIKLFHHYFSGEKYSRNPRAFWGFNSWNQHSRDFWDASHYNITVFPERDFVQQIWYHDRYHTLCRSRTYLLLCNSLISSSKLCLQKWLRKQQGISCYWRKIQCYEKGVLLRMQWQVQPSRKWGFPEKVLKVYISGLRSAISFLAQGFRDTYGRCTQMKMVLPTMSENYQRGLKRCPYLMSRARTATQLANVNVKNDYIQFWTNL